METRSKQSKGAIELNWNSFGTVTTGGNMTTVARGLPYQFIAKICLVFSDLGPLSFASTEEATSFKDR